MTSEKFCLRWNDFERNISGAFREIRDDKDFFDITLACEEEQIQAHKVILSACSPFFKKVLHKHPHAHPLLYLKGVKFQDLEAVLNFMYHGEVNVAQEELNSFLQVAEDLRVKGLTQNNASSSDRSAAPAAPPSKDNHSRLMPKPEVRAADPPPSRPRPHDPSSTPPPNKRPRPSPMPRPPPLEDDDIQEVVPIVKSEPRDVSLPLAPVAPSDVPAANNHGAMVMYDEDDPDGQYNQGQNVMMPQGGAVGTMDSYGADDSYGGDYGDSYSEVGEQYGDGSMMMGGQDNNAGLRTSGEDDHCPYCDKQMMRRNLQRHILVKHTHLQPSICQICQKTFKSDYSMKEHLRKSHGVLQTQPKQFI